MTAGRLDGWLVSQSAKWSVRRMDRLAARSAQKMGVMFPLLVPQWDLRHEASPSCSNYQSDLTNRPTEQPIERPDHRVCLGERK